MPLYEYVCRSCGHAFEELVYGNEQVACPSCATREVEKVLSAFAVGRSESSASCAVPQAGCGSCEGRGMCGMN